MTNVTDKQIFDIIRTKILPAKLTQAIVNMVNQNMKDPIKRAALVDSLGLEQCANPQYRLDEKILKNIYPNADVTVLPYIKKLAPIYGIVYKKEMAGFLANVLVESQGFKAKRESFAYRPERLLKVFPSRVKTLANAKALVAIGQPAIANFLYNGRYGNAPNSNDGWLFRGGSYIQLTFKDNYLDCQKRTGLPLITEPQLVEQPVCSTIIAMDFWYNNDCGPLSMAIKGNDTSALRKCINGGYNSLEEVQALYVKAMKYL